MALNDDLGPSLQPERLLEILDRHGVNFVVVGGLAGVAHGSAHPTFDLDVAYARDDANLSRLAAALRELAVKLRGAPADLPFQIDARTLANGSNFTFDTEFGAFDVLGDVEGIRSYEELRRAANVGELDGVSVRIASIDDLIAMKRAANRPKDRNMLEEYIVIADEQRRIEAEEKEG
jgi:hypothetical protein